MTTNVYNMTDTWNSGGTTFYAIKMNVTNTASAAASNLMDLQVDGTSVFTVNKRADNYQLPAISLGGDTTTGWFRNAANQWTWCSGATPLLSLLSSAMRLGDLPIVWSSTGNPTDGADVGITRSSAGVFKVTDAFSGRGDILTRGLRSAAVAFASAIGSPVEGTLQAFTDSSTATWGATITGGGANHVLGYFNGTNWTVAA